MLLLLFRHLSSGVCQRVWANRAALATTRLVERFGIESPDRGLALFAAVGLAAFTLHEITGFGWAAAVTVAAAAVLVPTAGCTLLDPTRVVARYRQPILSFCGCLHDPFYGWQKVEWSGECGAALI